MHSIQSQIDEHRSRLSQQEIEDAEKELQSLKTVVNDDTLTHKDSAKLNEAVESSKKAAMKIGEAIYRNAGQSSSSGSAGSGSQEQQQQQQQGDGQNQNQNNSQNNNQNNNEQQK